jgi:ubiquinone/menaquinone biosynthesis C-methylase UbiE
MELLGTRHPGREMLDAEHLDPEDLRINLREMASLNRLPGGIGASLAAIHHLLDGTADATVLDVGTGSGDLPAALLREAAPGRSVRVIATDLRLEVLAHARRRLAGWARVTLFEADARALPMADGSVDVAHASLMLHHLDPADAVRALAEMRRVARRGVVINDLRRGRIAFGLSSLVILALTRGRYTRHDGVLSARRAYTLKELDAMAAEAGLHSIWRSAPYLPRVTTAYARD